MIAGMEAEDCQDSDLKAFLQAVALPYTFSILYS
jgi:hypothetical protein